jgi:hypothetical protein
MTLYVVIEENSIMEEMQLPVESSCPRRNEEEHMAQIVVLLSTLVCSVIDRLAGFAQVYAQAGTGAPACPPYEGLLNDKDLRSLAPECIGTYKEAVGSGTAWRF